MNCTRRLFLIIHIVAILSVPIIGHTETFPLWTFKDGCANERTFADKPSYVQQISGPNGFEVAAKSSDGNVDKSPAAIINPIPVQYEMIDLGTMPDGWCETGIDDGTIAEFSACDINDQGQIVLLGRRADIFAPDSPGACDSGVLQDNTITRICAFRANAINNNGQVVGYSVSTGDGSIWQNGSMTGIGAGCLAYDINGNGQVAEYRLFAEAGFIWQNGALTYIGAFEEPHAINDKGQVVGYSSSAEAGFIWQDGITTYIGYGNIATSINNHSQVVGYSDSGAFLWQNGTITPLTGGQRACAINDGGQIAGYSSSRALLWQNGTVIDLGVLPGGAYSQALSINNNGWVVGCSCDSNQNQHAILWKPSVSSIPDTIITSPTNGYVSHDGNITVQFSGTGGAIPADQLVYQWRLDGGAWSDFSSTTSVTLTGLANGSHEFEVAARNATGTVDPTPATLSFVVDTNPPTISNINSNPSETSCQVIWTTDELATSQVEFGTSNEYGNATFADSTLVVFHSVIISHLQPATTYHFRVRSSDVYSNEQISDDYVFTTQSAPDLVVTAVIGPKEAWTQSAFNVSWTDKNQGIARAQNWTDKVYLSRSSNVSDQVQLLGEFPYNSELEAGSSIDRVQSVMINRASIADGNYYVIVVTDANNEVYEPLGEDNNSTAGNSTLVVYVNSLPDLQVTGVQAPASVVSGSSIAPSWIVTNVGKAVTGTPYWYDSVYLSTTTDLTGKVADLGQFYNISYLLPSCFYLNNGSVTIPSSLPSGTYYLIVQSDSTCQVEEDSRVNNVAASNAISVSRPTPGYLYVSSVTTSPAAPSIIYAGQPVLVNWTVTNTGQSKAVTNGTGYSWIDASVILSQTENGTSGYEYNHVGTLVHSIEPGESIASTTTIILPSDISGKWYFTVVPDVGNWTGAEKDLASASIGVTLPPSSDLQVDSVTAPKSSSGGNNVTVEWVTTNAGANDTGVSSWNDVVYLSTSSTLDTASATKLATVPYSGVLGAGASYTQSASFVLPICTSGEYNIFVCTDPDKNVTESDYTNNSKSAPDLLDVAATPSADLQVTLVNIPATATAGQLASISWTVQNKGQGTTSVGQWYDAVYLSSSSAFDPADAAYVGSFAHSGSVAPDGVYTTSTNITIPSGLSGAYYVWVVADADNSVAECGGHNDNRACSTGIINVASLPDLALISVDAASRVLPGQSASVSWTVANSGTTSTPAQSWTDVVYLGSSANRSSSDIVLASITHTGKVDPGRSYSASATVTIPIDAIGNYYIIVCTDISNVIQEGSENNNSTSAAIISKDKLPDLQISDVTIPDTANANSAVSLSWTVSNNGTDSTESGLWRDIVYLSSSAGGGSDDIELAAVNHSGVLGAGGSYEAYTDVKLPAGAFGEYYLRICTNDGSDIFESDTGNNCRSSAIHVNAAQLADLHITNVSTPTSVVAGTTVSVSWTASNDGDGPTDASAWFDNIYLSKDQVYDSNDIILGYVAHQGNLSIGKQYTQTASVPLPQGISGQYYVFVSADSRNTVTESNERNNYGYTPNSMNISIGESIDLIVTSVTMQTTGIPGEPATFTWTVKNQSSTDTVCDWEDAIYISSDKDLNTTALSLVGKVQHRGSLAAGATYTGTLTADLPAAVPGNYYAVAWTNDRGSARESNLANNISASADPFAIDITELELGVPYIKDALSPGEEHYYKVRAPEGQTMNIKLDSDSSDSCNELYVSYGSVPSRGLYDYSYSNQYEADQEITIPTTQSGWYYILVYGDKVPGVSPGYGILAQLVPFGATSIAPQSGGNTGNVTLTVKGALFTDVTAAFLIDSEGNQIEASRIAVESANVIYPEFNLIGANPGVYSLKLSDPLQPDVILADCFTLHEGGQAQLEMRLNTPGVVAPGRKFDFTIAYSNVGNIDMFAPPLIISLDPSVSVYLPDGTPLDSEALHFYGTSSTGYEAVLKPGQTEIVSLIGIMQSSATAASVLSSTAGQPVTICFDKDGQAKCTDANETNARKEFDLRNIGVNRTNSCPCGSDQGGCTSVGCLKSWTMSQIESVADRYHAKYSKGIVITGGCEFDGHASGRGGIVPSHPNGGKLDLSTTDPDFNAFVRSFGDGNKDPNKRKSQGPNNRTCPGSHCCAERYTDPETGSDWCYERTRRYRNGKAVVDENGKPVYDYHWDVAFKPQPNSFSESSAPSVSAMATSGSGDGAYCRPIIPVTPHDPNNKIGPLGYGPQGFVSTQQPMLYTVNFENVATATAPAQTITITDHLDPNLDWRTFRIKTISFGSTIVPVPDNKSYYHQRLSVDGNSSGLLADVSAGIDISSGKVTCVITSIDPSTGQAPSNPLIGVLPPNDANGSGEGYVSYTVKPKSTDSTGTTIINSATVIFDNQPPIDTGSVINTVDGAVPASAVAALPDRESETFTVSWSGSDDSTGSGLESYDVYVSDNDAVYVPWLTNTTDTSAHYAGVAGHKYKFYSIARDNAGNVEIAPATADAATMVTAATPSNPMPANGATSVSPLTLLSWVDGYGSTSSDVYLWPSSSTKPSSPTFAGITAGSVSPDSLLQYSTTYTWQVIAKGEPAGNIAGDNWTFTTMDPPSQIDLSNARKTSDGSWAGLSGLVVTAVFDGYFYAEKLDRTCGIRIVWSGPVSAGSKVDITGMLATTDDYEKCIRAASVTIVGTGNVRPLGIISRSLGGSDFNYDASTGSGQMGTSAWGWIKTENGSQAHELLSTQGLNNIGLLVKLAGRVITTNGNSCYVDDGSGYDEGDPDMPGTRVVLPVGAASPAAGSYVSVVGISSCYKSGGHAYRQVLVSKATDLIIIADE